MEVVVFIKEQLSPCLKSLLAREAPRADLAQLSELLDDRIDGAERARHFVRICAMKRRGKSILEP